MKKRVLIIVGTYLPGFKGGGHIRSIAGIVDYLGKEFDFYIICQDRDFGDLRPYEDVEPARWTDVGDSKVMYLRNNQFSVSTYRQIYKSLKPDFIYFNTVFSIRETILPLLMVMVLKTKTKVILAPRGCLDPGALSLKARKKHLFLQFFKVLKLHKIVVWHASTELEKGYIQDQFGKVEVRVAQNLPTLANSSLKQRASKKSGEVKMIFLSRITPKKNLQFLLNVLPSISGRVYVTVAGPSEDLGYWNDFQSKINRIQNVILNYIGYVAHDQVLSVLSENHFFVSPTLGENFGHSIIEAFDAGLGVIISDRTPWRNLIDYGVGWDLPLEDVALWIKAFQTCIDMDDEEFVAISNKAKLMRDILWNLDSVIADNVALFNSEERKITKYE